MITDDLHRTLHNAAQKVCLAISQEQFDVLPPAAQGPLARMAIFCGCTHVAWWNAEICDIDDPERSMP
ncbi:MAG: hypothetical protein V1755_08655 [Chloroflexota bacterium]